MYVVAYKINDSGDKVIIGFERKFIDPMATQIAARESMTGGDHEKNLLQAQSDYKSEQTPGKAQAVFESKLLYQQELDKRVRENPVYLIRLDKSENEVEVDDGEFGRLFALTREHKLVTIGGEVITDDGS